MAILDVNALVALAWDSHVHHSRMRNWFSNHADSGWQTCPITESGFVRVSANPKVLPHPIDVNSARQVLRSMRQVGSHQFLTDDVSITDTGFPEIHGYRQVTDAHLLMIARRNSKPLLTFDAAIGDLARPREVILLVG